MIDLRTVLLSAAIVEEWELIWVCCGWRVDLFLFSCGCWRKHGVDGQLKYGVLFTCAFLRDEISIVMKCLNKQLFIGN
jgi:hypothetical protein